ncbi:MAG TPA: glutathione S-transferase family protein [Stellaceae bacterium]|nr:glutathione S-transferase family protein [Stellaceae bacterium]
MPQSSFTLYGVAISGPTYKVALMLTLCGEPFAYRHVDLFKGAHKQPEFLAINRYGQVPALVHGELRLCQSGAILQYLSEVLGKFAGADTLTRQRTREWLFWEADRLSPGINRTRAIARGFLEADPATAKVYREAGEAGLKVLDESLAASNFIAGAMPTIGDIACYGAIVFAEEGGFRLADWPHVKAWAGRMAALPGFKAPLDLLPMNDMR